MNSSKVAATPQLGRKRRPRRSTGEVIERIVASAIEEFQENGYSGARTATIARRAGVVEALIFTHFGSKENLFQRAIFEQLDRQFTEFASAHRFDASDSERRRSESRAYINAQQEFLRRNGRMFKSLVINEAYGGIEAENVPQLSGLQDHLDKMVGIVEARGEGEAQGRPELTARISFATVLACALFRDWLFPPGLANDADIREAVTDFVMEGARSSV